MSEDNTGGNTLAAKLGAGASAGGVKQPETQPNHLDSAVSTGMVGAGANAPDEGARVSETAPKKAPGFYSHFAGCVQGKLKRYDWPMASPFDLKQVAEEDQAQVEEHLQSMVKRGFADYVE